jgi:hypothetical protein
MNQVAFPLESFREVFGFHPWHFWQIADEIADGPTKIGMDGGADLVREYRWQSGGANNGRNDIREALSESATTLRKYLGFPVVRTWATETVKLGRLRGNCREFLLCNGHVRKIGKEMLTTLGTYTASYSDEDGDGLDERLTVSVPINVITSAMSDEELFLSHVGADGETGKVSPIKIKRNVDGSATITGRAWAAINPSRYEGAYDIPPEGGTQSNAALDVNESDNFASKLELRRHWTDTSVGATLSVDTCKCGCQPCACTWNCCDSSSLNTDGTSKVTIRRGDVGICAITGCAAADSVTVSYEAGYACNDCGVDLSRVICRLAATLLSPQCSSSKSANGEFTRWKVDRAYYSGGPSGSSEGFRYTDTLDNPFGTQEGAIWAWSQIKSLMKGRGVFA